MKAFLKIISLLGLVLNIIPALLVFNNVISFDIYKTMMLYGTTMWFISAPFWVNKNRETGF